MNLIPKPVVALLWSSLILSAVPLRGAVVTANFTSATTVPVTAASYTATGNTVDFTLNFAPVAGTNLTVVKNTGTAPIQGVFANLAQGQLMQLTDGGVSYSFTANYFGGTGNDLVLQWANTRLLAWGNASNGKLGNHSNISSWVPVPVDSTGMLAGKTTISVGGGWSHSLALCSDGTLAAWGYNYFHELGSDSTIDSSLPVPVDRSGVLAGKTVIAIAVKRDQNLALCSDGTLVAWGSNNQGQLGTTGPTTSGVPVLVNRTGVLAGKKVIAISAGGFHNLALCADGTLASWGFNDSGQLGNNSSTFSSVPVLVNTGALKPGERFAPRSQVAGYAHTLAVVVSPPPPAAVTGAATGISDTGATLNGSVNPSGTTYHYRLVADGPGGHVRH